MRATAWRTLNRIRDIFLDLYHQCLCTFMWANIYIWMPFSCDLFLLDLLKRLWKLCLFRCIREYLCFCCCFFLMRFCFFFASARVPTIVVFNLLWPNTYFTFGAVIGKLKEHFSGDVVNTGTNVKLGANANVFPIRWLWILWVRVESEICITVRVPVDSSSL